MAYLEKQIRVLDVYLGEEGADELANEQELGLRVDLRAQALL